MVDIFYNIILLIFNIRIKFILFNLVLKINKKKEKKKENKIGEVKTEEKEIKFICSFVEDNCDLNKLLKENDNKYNETGIFS